MIVVSIYQCSGKNRKREQLGRIRYLWVGVNFFLHDQGYLNPLKTDSSFAEEALTTA
jgi:hypothetical protein